MVVSAHDSLQYCSRGMNTGSHSHQLDNKLNIVLSLGTGFKAKICRSGPSLEAVIFLGELSGGKKSEK